VTALVSPVSSALSLSVHSLYAFAFPGAFSLQGVNPRCAFPVLAVLLFQSLIPILWGAVDRGRSNSKNKTQTVCL
jgi:hypothetical protein